MLARITLENVNVHLRERQVLHALNWSLSAGEHWAVVGSNGSGKSTLLRVIAGSQWIDADGGTRTYSPDGLQRDVVARAATWIRYVSAEQHERYARLDLGLTGRTVIESGFDNSLYVARAPAAQQAQRVDALLSEFDLYALAGRPLRELSSGQIRRLLIARALVGEPRVIVLDEFTNGLDRVARRDVLRFVDRLAPHVALVIASHRSDDFPAAVTHTATLRDGRLIGVRRGRPPVNAVVVSEIPPNRAPAQNDRTILLSITHADVYRGSRLILEDINWQLRRGEHTAIRGANGAGKTTFAGLIAGTIPAAAGAEIVRFGQTGPFDIWKLKERVAHLSDDLQIAYDLGESAEAVVLSGFPASIGLFVEPTAEQRAAVVSILERIGLTSLRGRIFTRLSYGERRKILIARSLVRTPAIFILDEVWNGLDRTFRSALRNLLSEMAKAGTTIVTIAHDEDDDLSALTQRNCCIENRAVLNEAPPSFHRQSDARR